MAEEKLEITDKIDKLFEEASQYRERFEKKWVEQERFYFGNQWKHAKNRPVKNWCFTIVEGEIPILTDARPSSAVIPQQPEQIEDAKILESAMQYVFDDQSQQLKVSEAVRTMLKTGTGWHYIDYDEDGSDGEGRILIKNLNWRYVYIDPTADEIDDAAYAIIRMPIRKDDLKRKYPSKSKEIDELEEMDIFSHGRQTDGLNPEIWDGIGGISSFVSERDRFSAEDFITIEETWLKDYSMKKIPEEETEEEIALEQEQIISGVNPDVFKYEDHEFHIQAHGDLLGELERQMSAPEIDPETGEEMVNPDVALAFAIASDHIEMHKTLQEENPSGKKPKFKNNLRLVIKSKDLVLYDGDPPVDDGMIPLVPFYCYKTHESIYGQGELKNIVDAQKMYNDLDWAEHKGLRLNANSGWVLDEESGVDETTLTNDPGIVVKKKVGTEVSRIPPGQVSPQLDHGKSRNREAMEAISGIHEVTQGRRPAGVTAAAAINALQEQAIGRIRLKTRYLEEYSLLREGKLVASRIVNYWSTERTLRIYDKSGQIQFVDYDPDTIQQLNYKLKYVPGSTSGIDKGTIFEVMSQLFQGGAIPPKTFFEVVDIPFRQKILDDLSQQDEMQMQLEALAAENEALKAQLGAPPSMDATGELPPPVI